MNLKNIYTNNDWKAFKLRVFAQILRCLETVNWSDDWCN